MALLLMMVGIFMLGGCDSGEKVVDKVTAKLPNIIFILADDLGYADLGCYGHPYAKTPAIDRLAEEGTRFTQFYATGITCSPSRTGFMTGLFPARFQKYPGDFGFGDRTTITDLLKERGYRTGHFGKWDMGPTTEGVYGIDQYAAGSGKKKNPLGRDTWLFDEAIKFIKDNADKPFYVNIWGHITHYPVDTHPELVKKFKDVAVNRKDFSKTMQHKYDECLQIGGDLNTSMRQYFGDVLSLDMQVDRVLKVIDELGLRENTLVVFSSDQGPAPVLSGWKKKRSRKFSANMLGYAGVFRGGKHEQYEGGVRVPFIIRWPGHVKKGRRDSNNVISGIDWMPTLCSIAGIKELPEQLDGEDVSDIWFGADRVRTKPLFWKVGSMRRAPAMRDGKWKFHLNPRHGDRIELYDLSVDPSESRNLADQNPEVVAELRAKLEAWVAELPKEYKKDAAKKDKKKRKRKKRTRLW